MPNTKSTSLRDLVQSGQVDKLQGKSPSELKAELVKSGERFTITEIQYAVDGEFDPFWHVSIMLGDKEGVLNFPSTPARDELFEQLATVAANTPISDVQLKSFPTKKGHPFVTIVAAE